VKNREVLGAKLDHASIKYEVGGEFWTGNVATEGPNIATQNRLTLVHRHPMTRVEKMGADHSRRTTSNDGDV